MNLVSKISHISRETLDYIILIFNISSLIILFVKFEEFSNVFLRSSHQLLSENYKICLIFVIILLSLSIVFFFYDRTKVYGLFLILLFSSSYSLYLYYNLYILYDTCSCQSLFSFISLKENFQISLLIVTLCIVSLILSNSDRIKSNKQAL
ncbi:hypothetical protein Aoki45_26960 [Algoriphagus sp. oki45]|nr:hypothetical protein Aoki45_26960 [Algoriphagus sp. oki45]